MKNINIWENKKYKNKKKNILNIFLNMQKGSDLWLTPRYAVEILMPFLKKKYIKKIFWFPFDNKDSEFVQVFKKNKFNVVFSHLETGEDFFKFEPKKWDILISNPPWSIKDKILKRCFELNKPFALLLPIHALSGKFRWKLFRENKLQLLMSKERICFNHKTHPNKHNRPPFESGYFCWKLLSKQLNWEK